MFEEEFYADPTVFDQWHSDARGWIIILLKKLSPFFWALLFGSFATAFLLVAFAVFLDSMQQASSGQTVVSWNRALAAAVTLLIASSATIGLFRQAVAVWPHLSGATDFLGNAADSRRSSAAGRATPLSGSSAPPTAATDMVDRQAIQEFFAGVREAGVNVAIAQALFAAGVRSVHQLARVEDSYLHGIRGVGPATVRKLRAHFSQI